MTKGRRLKTKTSDDTKRGEWLPAKVTQVGLEPNKYGDDCPNTVLILAEHNVTQDPKLYGNYKSVSAQSTWPVLKVCVIV